MSFLAIKDDMVLANTSKATIQPKTYLDARFLDQKESEWIDKQIQIAKEKREQEMKKKQLKNQKLSQKQSQAEEYGGPFTAAEEVDELMSSTMNEKQKKKNTESRINPTERAIQSGNKQNKRFVCAQQTN